MADVELRLSYAFGCLCVLFVPHLLGTIICKDNCSLPFLVMCYDNIIFVFKHETICGSNLFHEHSFAEFEYFKTNGRSRIQ